MLHPLNWVYLPSKFWRKARAWYAKARQRGVITGIKVGRVAAAALVLSAILTAGGEEASSGLGGQEGGKVAGERASPTNQQSAVGSRQSPPFRIPDSPDLGEIGAKAVYVVDGQTAKVLYQKEPDLRLPPASTTKIMTFLVARENYRLDETITVPKECANLTGPRLGLGAGDQVPLEELLYGLLVQSASDAACTLAGGLGPEEFVTQMNQQAAKLGLTNTHFTNPLGLDDSANGNHYSSARDLTTLARQALKNGVFRKIVGTRQGGTNELLRRLPGTTGVKTGWTEEALGCLVFSHEKDGHEIVGAILGSQDRFGETEKLIGWIWRVYSW